MSILLSVQDLRMHYPIRGGVLFRQIATNYAVDGISFDITEGETLGLVGESGCGKSTVAKTILRLYKATGGTVRFDGADIFSLPRQQLRRLREDMQIILQDPMESLNSRQTIGAILEEPFIIHKIGTAEQRRMRVDKLLEQVGLQRDMKHRYPHEFSGGQRQRIGIARAIALQPRLLVCDEPVSALDVSIQSQILNLLLDLQREMHLTVLFIAHNLSVVKHVSDRIAVMYLGKIVEFGSAEEIYKKPRHPYTRALLDAIPEPVPKRKASYTALQGEVPSPIDPPSGCRFRTRCPYAVARCAAEEPLLTQSGTGGHQTACHYPLAP